MFISMDVKGEMNRQKSLMLEEDTPLMSSGEQSAEKKKLDCSTNIID